MFIHVNVKAPLEMYFIYLGNNEIHCILKACYIISVLFSTKCHYFHESIFFCSNNHFFIKHTLKLKYNQVIQRLISLAGSIWCCLAQTSLPHALNKPCPSNPFQACLHFYRAPVKISLYKYYNPRTTEQTSWHWILTNCCTHFGSGSNETHTAHTWHEASPVYIGLLIIASKTQKKVLTTLKKVCLYHTIFKYNIKHHSSFLLHNPSFPHILAAALQWHQQ